MSKEIIRIDNIHRNFEVGNETVKALWGVSFAINAGEFVTIMGTSGSGKSTLLNLLGCLEIGRASCRERVSPLVYSPVAAASLKTILASTVVRVIVSSDSALMYYTVLVC